MQYKEKQMNDKLRESKGYKKLLASVSYDIEGKGCTANDCGCNNNRKCGRDYCDKFKWVLDRAEHYAEKLNMDVCDVLDNWEEQRGYWYMNYYQDCNQPIIDGSVFVFDTNEDVIKSIGDKGFRCPNCKGISTHPLECNSGIKIKEKECDWKSYGLFSLNLVTVVVKKPFSVSHIFKPVNWEDKNV